MSVPEVVSVPLAGDATLPLLVCGPSLGTSAAALWLQVAERLGDAFYVLGWDLPRHGRSAAGPDGFTIDELAAGVLELVDREQPGATFHYAGDSVGGAVGLQLALDAPERVRSAVVLCSGARIGEPAGWLERAATVRARGTAALLESTPGRRF